MSDKSVSRSFKSAIPQANNEPITVVLSQSYWNDFMQILESSTRSLKLLPCLICFYPLLIPVRSLSMVCVLISDMRFCWQSKIHSATWIHINTCHWSWSSSDYGAYAKRASSTEWHFRIAIIEFSNHYGTQHEWQVNLHQTSGFTYYYGAYGILCSCILCIISALWPGM